jgi:hypothetical protein
VPHKIPEDAWISSMLEMTSPGEHGELAGLEDESTGKIGT